MLAMQTMGVVMAGDMSCWHVSTPPGHTVGFPLNGNFYFQILTQVIHSPLKFIHWTLCWPLSEIVGFFCMGANSYSFLLLIYHIFNLKTLLFWSCLICGSLWLFCLYVNLSPSGQNGHHFADDIFKWIFFNGTVWISIQISLKYAPKGPINNESALV